MLAFTRQRELGLRGYVLFLGALPLLPQILLTTKNEQQIWVASRWMYSGASLWLRNILLGEQLLPKAYESKQFLYSQTFADILAANFRLATAVYPRTCSTALLEFPSPAALWFHCCWTRSEQSLANTGLTGRAVLIGKREHYESSLKLCSNLESLSLELKSIPTADENPELLLLIEAQKIARANDNFYLDHLLPYLRTFRRTAKKIKECKELQLYYLLPDGTIFVTGKDKKLPRYNHRELLSLNHRKVPEFM